MKFEIKNRVITGDNEILVGDNSNYEAEFTFDAEWNGVTKTARFISCNGDFVDQLLENDKCTIPCKVLKCGYCRIGVYSAEMTTTEHKIFVTRSIKNDDGYIYPPPPDVYEQIMKKIDDIVITGGVPDYSQIPNKPSINGVELVGDKTTEDLGIVSEESDPTVPNHVKNITEDNINEWNDKANKSDIPDVSGFITNAVDNLVNYYLKSETYSKEEVNALVGNIKGLKFEIVQVLPSANIDSSTIYLMVRADGGGNDYYEEYLYINDKFELIGSTKITLDGYVTTDALNNALSEYAKKSELPTKTSELTNDSGFITAGDIPQQEVDLTNYYTKSETESYVASQIASAITEVLNTEV